MCFLQKIKIFKNRLLLCHITLQQPYLFTSFQHQVTRQHLVQKSFLLRQSSAAPEYWNHRIRNANHKHPQKLLQLQLYRAEWG